MADLLIKNADYLLTIDPDRRILTDGALVVSDGRIEAIGKTAEVEAAFPLAAETIDARGRLITPGFIDAHQHLTDFLGRGLGDDVPLPVFLHQRCYPLEAALSEEEAYISAVCALLESIRHGTTCFGDPGSQTPEASVRAVEELGARAVLMRSLTDVASERAMPGTFDSTTEGALEAGEAFVKTYNGAADGRIRAWFSLRTERMVSDELCRSVADLAERYATGVCSHMISNRDSVEHHRKVFSDQRPIERYQKNGVLRPNLQLVHCHFLEEEECDLLAERGVKVAVCPTASVVFGWGGIRKATHLKLLERGVCCCVGSDIGSCSHTLDILRIAQYFRTYRDILEDASLMPAETILEHLTISGARGLLWEDEIGSLEKGKKADLLIWDLDRPEWMPLLNPLSNLAHGVSGDSVETVIIDGRTIVRQGEFVNLDARDFMRRGRRLARDAAQRTGLSIHARPRWPVL